MTTMYVTPKTQQEAEQFLKDQFNTAYNPKNNKLEFETPEAKKNYKKLENIVWKGWAEQVDKITKAV